MERLSRMNALMCGMIVGGALYVRYLKYSAGFS